MITQRHYRIKELGDEIRLQKSIRDNLPERSPEWKLQNIIVRRAEIEYVRFTGEEYRIGWRK